MRIHSSAARPMHGTHRNLQRDGEAKPTILPDLGQTINGPFVAWIGIKNITRQCVKKQHKSPVRVRGIKILRLAANLFAPLASKRGSIGIVGKIADYQPKEYQPH